MATVGVVAAAWIAIAVPAAVVVGRVIARRRREEDRAARDAPTERPRVDERH